ncbi:hypothetical protein [Pyrodictium abyssi]|uniref:Uncharacterized protein n=1 Tax=Pyrodictium abyssi TaxID=54256 RepID=A0ABN6ZM53_9CREN|nr:hypothetical protein PABY_00560 [Pyrodictium abyssi]
MLVNGIAYGGELEEIAETLASLRRLAKAYISVPTRPPAEPWAGPPSPGTVEKAYRVFASRLGASRVEVLARPEHGSFTVLGDAVEEGLLEEVETWARNTTAGDALQPEDSPPGGLAL